jgi:hypothetical protein
MEQALKVILSRPTIISAKDGDEDVSAEQMEKDRPALLRQHQSALKNDATWEFFGGVLTIEGRTYQVV